MKTLAVTLENKNQGHTGCSEGLARRLFKTCAQYEAMTRAMVTYKGDASGIQKAKSRVSPNDAVTAFS
jgi:hypothetical protein